MAHKHTADKIGSHYGYTACVAPYDGRCNPASHGGVTYTETCACGATREVNSTGAGREERSPWDESAMTPVLRVRRRRRRVVGRD